jgi:hypothetical protein
MQTMKVNLHEHLRVLTEKLHIIPKELISKVFADSNKREASIKAQMSAIE